MTHAALCGLEYRQTNKIFNRSPEEYVHGHTLSIMLTQITVYSESQRGLEFFTYVFTVLGLVLTDSEKREGRFN